MALHLRTLCKKIIHKENNGIFILFRLTYINSVNHSNLLFGYIGLFQEKNCPVIKLKKIEEIKN